MGVENGVEDGVAKLSMGDPGILPPPPGSAGGFSFANAPVANAGGGGNPGGFSFNLAPPAPPAAGDAGGGGGDDEDDEDDDEDGGGRLPREVLGRVLGLKQLHEDREAAMKDYVKERAALDVKFRAVFEPIYAKRSAIVRGETEPSLSEEDAATVEAAGAPPAEGGEAVAGVPDFWLSALGRVHEFEQLLEEADVPALKYLVDVRCRDRDDLSGFSLEFEFAENPYFTNAVLTKEYGIPNLVEANGQPELESIAALEPIDWKDAAHNLCSKEVKKKQKSKRGKNAGQTRVVTKVEATPSFFHFFESIDLPSNDDDDDAEDDEADDEKRERIDVDVEFAFRLRHHVIPNAVLFFTGEVEDDDDDDDDYYEGEDDESD